MAEQVRETRETVVRENNADNVKYVTTTPETVVREEDARGPVARTVYYIAGVLLALLAFRFVLSLLGANRGNAFADFIYSITYPFVAPFFGLFGYTMRYGVSRFEVETLVAMLVYALIAYGIVKLLEIPRRRDTRT